MDLSPAESVLSQPSRAESRGRQEKEFRAAVATFNIERRCTCSGDEVHAYAT